MRCLLAAILLLFTFSANAQTLWSDREKVAEHLAAKYRENQISMGIAADGTLVEVFASARGETWTIVVTLPNGLSRVVASGINWLTLPVARIEPVT